MASSFDQTPEYRNAVRRLESWGVSMRQDGLRLGYARPWLYTQIPSLYDGREKMDKKVFSLTDDEAEKVTREVMRVHEIDWRYGEIIDYYFISMLSLSKISLIIKKSENWVSDARKTAIVWLANKI